jgi:hypothetical protein
MVILIAKSFFLFTPHPTLSHKGRGELEEKTFGKRYMLKYRQDYHKAAFFGLGSGADVCW